MFLPRSRKFCPLKTKDELGRGGVRSPENPGQEDVTADKAVELHRNNRALPNSML